ncbi:hypothetical protein [Streptomonospora litoralis]|uniref:Uncharacterized protein n=1 Tax=Streptomonospora litoralis TaxID=2498135 RepID=A0A4P6PZY6_9ACTN|nr:hypothetical protein [Streptomonospora litoralis]QBI52109.1 hypothetical protein EKD16_01460 [Streptomonospora litoralis]
MRTWRRKPLAAAAGAALLVAGAACTADDEPDRPEESPRPLPTAFGGELPPGIGAEPLRHLHGPGGEGPGILDDEMGVRISSVGESFLISSNSEERHLLLGAADGETLWRGERHIRRFGADADGSQVLVVDGADGGTEVIGDDGETVWRGSSPRETFLGGAVVRRPADWSPDDPYGDYTVLAPGGEELWDYTFEAPDDDTPGADATAGPGASPSAEPSDGAPADPDTTPDPDRGGVPVAARDGVLLLDDGAGLLQARGIGPDSTGELLWSFAGDDPDLAGGTDVQRPRAEVVGTYDVPVEEAAEPGGADDDSPAAGSPSRTSSPSPGAGGVAEDGGGQETEASTEASPGPGDGADTAEPTRPAVLVRWSVPEEPSVLSLHDLHTGELLWSFAEPGANPGGDEFAPPPLPGALYEPATGTLLLPQATGEVSLIAVDLAAGEVRWAFEDEFEHTISPALAIQGYIYGDTRGADDTTAQIVLDAEDKDVAAEGLGAYVEAATRQGYSIVVSDRQRFVFPPADGAGTDEETSPTG